MTTEPSPAPPTPRRRFSLSIRGLMIVVLVLGGVMGRLAYRARVQRDAVEALQAAGASVSYDWDGGIVTAQAAPWPKWLVRSVGPDFLGNIVMVWLDQVVLHSFKDGEPEPLLAQVRRLDHLEELHLMSMNLSPESLRLIGEMTQLKRLTLFQCKLGGSGLAQLKGLTHLEELNVSYTNLSQNDPAALASFTSLKKLGLVGPSVTDDALKSLENLTKLEDLEIMDSPTTNAGLVHLRRLNLKYLNLEETRVTDLNPIAHMTALNLLSLKGDFTDEGLAPISGFTNLLNLEVYAPELTDSTLKRLHGLERLAQFTLFSLRTTPQAVAALQAKLPLLRINGQPSLVDLSQSVVPASSPK